MEEEKWIVKFRAWIKADSQKDKKRRESDWIALIRGWLKIQVQ